MYPKGDPKAEIIRDIIDRRRCGMHASEIINYLLRIPLDISLVQDYLGEAFTLDSIDTLSLRYLMFPGDGIKEVGAEIDYELDPLIDDRVEAWDCKMPYTDVIRIKDRSSFLSFCRKHDVILITRPASHLGRPYIGLAQYRPIISPKGCYPRLEEPNKGLLAVGEPNDDFLIGVLSNQGLKVASEGEGYVLQDAWGRYFYEGYELLGIYEFENGANSWTPELGRKFQSDLNRRLGGTLILQDPLEIQYHSEQSNERLPDCPLPVLAFTPQGEQFRFSSQERLALYYMNWGIEWVYMDIQKEEEL